MSISSVSSGTAASYAANSQQNDLRNAFKQVADAINKGDLEGAQNAFDNLAELLNSAPQGASQSASAGSQSASRNGSGPSNLSSLLDQIGDALQSGDLDQAKQALQNLQQTAQSRHHHHHHHGGGAPKPQQDANAATSVSGQDAIGSIDLTV